MSEDLIQEATEEITDNSEEVINEEPEETDNSQADNIEEPENQEVDEKEEQPKSKFNTIEEATKSYSELEKKLGQQSNELGELRKIKEVYEKQQADLEAQKLQEAKKKGFNSIQEFTNHKEEVLFVADKYYQHISECDYPDEMVELLEQYKVNPTNELLATIKSEFPLDTVEEIAGDLREFRGQLQHNIEAQQIEQITQSAREYLQKNVEKYPEEFKNPAFNELYGEAFKAIGCNLDTDKFVGLMREFAKEAIKAEGFKKDVVKENSDATDEIAGLSLGNPAKQSNISDKLLTDMTQEELEQYFDKHK